MKYLSALLIALSALPAMAQQVIPSGTTTIEIKFVMVDENGDPVEGATITGVSRVRGTGSMTAMTTPTTGHKGKGLHYLVADEDTTITEGLTHEDMTFVIEASDAKTAFVQAVIEAEQATLGDLVTAVVDGIDTWWKSVSYFVQSPKGDTQYINHATDPTSGSNPTSYTDAPAGGTDTTP